MSKSIKFDERVYTCILCIFVYGFYGIMTPSLADLEAGYLAWVYFFLPIITLASYLMVNSDGDGNGFNIRMPCVSTSLLLNLGFAVVIALVTTYFVTLSLTGDELFYASYGFIHSAKIIPILALEVPDMLSLDASIVIRLITLVFFILLFFLCYVLLRSSESSYLFLTLMTLLILILARLLFVYLGGNPVIHTPLTSAYIALIGTFVGISDLALQSGQLFIFVVFGFFVFTRFKLSVGISYLAFMLVLAFLSIPAVFLLGSDLEPSLWTMICYSIVLLYLAEKKFKEHKFLVCLVVLFSFFRLQAIFALVPIILHLLTFDDYSRVFKVRARQYVNVLSPGLVFLPFFVYALVEGSAATTELTFSISRLIEIIIDGTMWRAYADVFSPAWLLLYLGLVLLCIRSRATQINLVFFFVLSFVFFSINEDLWSFSKYRVEVFSPLLLAQLYLFTKQFDLNHSSTLIVSIAIAAIYFNVQSLVNFPVPCSKEKGVLQNYNLRYKIDYGCNYLNQPPYDYSKAITYLNKNSSINFTYIPGVQYGVFMHAMHGASVQGYLRAQKVWNEHIELNSQLMAEFSADPEFIHSDLRIKYVLLGFTKDINLIRNDLIAKDWMEIVLNKNEKSLPISLLRRPL
jgi:hypothetical protein